MAVTILPGTLPAPAELDPPCPPAVAMASGHPLRCASRAPLLTHTLNSTHGVDSTLHPSGAGFTHGMDSTLSGELFILT
jgi:hypothetical protein